MRSKIENILFKVFSERMAKQANRVELMPKYSLQKNANLDESEKEQIDNTWGRLCNKIDYRYWEMYKGMFHFSPYLMPDDIYVRSILRVLNPIRKCYCLQNKNMYPILYTALRMPMTLINCVDEHVLDKRNNTVDYKDILKILRRDAEVDKLILKPSVDSCSGMGVKILNLKDEKSCDAVLKAAGSNFVIQEVLSQSETTKRFNESSLNTFRINTLNINGLISVENIMFRHGRGDSIVDNAGSGGICVGFNPNGTVVGKAIDAKLNVYNTTPFGEKYSDLKIDELQNISDTAINAHREYLPMLGHAAWDFALDKDNNPVFIEVNLGWPGIMTEQLSSCRPIFGNRMKEVVEYAVDNQKIMKFTDFIGHWT